MLAGSLRGHSKAPLGLSSRRCWAGCQLFGSSLATAAQGQLTASWAHSRSWQAFCGLAGMAEGHIRQWDMGEATHHWACTGKGGWHILLSSLRKCLASPTQFYSRPVVAKLTLPRQLQSILLEAVICRPHPLLFLSNLQCLSLWMCRWMLTVKSAQKAPSFQALPSTAWLPHPLLAQQPRDPCRRNHLLYKQDVQFTLLWSASPWKSVSDCRGSRKKILTDWCPSLMLSN